MRTALAFAVTLCAAPAAAATMAVGAGPGSGPATQFCTGPAGPISGTSLVEIDKVCSRADVGFGHAHAVASVGHLGAEADAASFNGNSLSAGNGGDADYTDSLIFSAMPGAPGAPTFADVSLSLLVDGVINAANPNGGFGFGSIEGSAILNGQFFNFRHTVLGDGRTEGFNNFSATGDFTTRGGGVFTTPLIRVALGTPVFIALHLQASAGASGPFSSGLSDFSGSFKFAEHPFNLPEGITVNAGDYLVNNRFIDPLAPPTGAVPEPAAWALMITGFGLAGATLRRRHLLV